MWCHVISLCVIRLNTGISSITTTEWIYYDLDTEKFQTNDRQQLFLAEWVARGTDNAKVMTLN